MSHWLAVIPIVIATALGALPASAQSTDDTLRALQRDVEALRKDVQEIKELLRARGAAAPAPAEPWKDLVLSLEGRVVQGAPAARVVLVDFTDYQ
jgi:hypothetical protein